MNPETLLQSLRFVLCRTSHPGNIGATARAMKTMGITRLSLVEPRFFPHPEAVALATSSADVLEGAQVVDALDAALADSTLVVAISGRLRDLAPETLPLADAAPRMVEHVRAGGKAALLFGNETAGLTNAEVMRCDLLAYIPSDPECHSLNLAQAAQVAAYELRKAAFALGETVLPLPGLATPAAGTAASHAELEGFYAHLEQAMIDSGFLNPAAPKRLMPKLRRLFARARLEKEEVNILRGILSATHHSMPVHPAKIDG
ncbi:MAG: RNA methyltransferase [Zoogloeaceae bacterium]|jgi:tRNA/rRNA methyltransferase|nr:RNA methyltransferase [Zoogloeaceae bacterium]